VAFNVGQHVSGTEFWERVSGNECGYVNGIECESVSDAECNTECGFRLR
jgi:hypothetical protein